MVRWKSRRLRFRFPPCCMAWTRCRMLSSAWAAGRTAAPRWRWPSSASVPRNSMSRPLRCCGALRRWSRGAPRRRGVPAGCGSCRTGRGRRLHRIPRRRLRAMRRKSRPHREKAAPAASSAELPGTLSHWRPGRRSLRIVKNYSATISAAFTGSSAYVSGDYVQIDGAARGSVSCSWLGWRKSSQRGKMRDASRQVHRKVYKLGPYKPAAPEEEQQEDPLLRLADRARDAGIEVTGAGRPGGALRRRAAGAAILTEDDHKIQEVV